MFLLSVPRSFEWISGNWRYPLKFNADFYLSVCVCVHFSEGVGPRDALRSVRFERLFIGTVSFENSVT